MFTRLYLSVSFCLSIEIYVQLFCYLPVHLPMHLQIYQSIKLSIYLFGYLSVCSPACLFACLSVCRGVNWRGVNQNRLRQLPRHQVFVSVKHHCFPCQDSRTSEITTYNKTRVNCHWRVAVGSRYALMNPARRIMNRYPCLPGRLRFWTPLISEASPSPSHKTIRGAWWRCRTKHVLQVFVQVMVWGLVDGRQ